jgi:dihydrofolate reductase
MLAASLYWHLISYNQIMRKLILQEWLTIDGFVADRNGNLDFFISPELSKGSDEDLLRFMETIDTILLGAVTYKLFVDFWPAASTETEIIADKLNSTEKIVFSNSLTRAPWGKWPDATVVKTDASKEVYKLKSQAGKNMVLWGSISLAQSLMKENLIDEYHLRICPVAFGSGKSFFPANMEPLNLKLVESKQYSSGLVLLQYEPNK